MKFWSYLLNPSKKMRHFLTQKQHDSPIYILKKRIQKLHNQTPLTINSQSHTTHFSIFRKLIILSLVTLLVGLITYTYLNHFLKTINLDKVGDKDMVGSILVSAFFVMFITALLWWLGFSYYVAFLKLGTVMLSVGYGYFLGSQYAIFKFHFKISDNNQIAASLFFYIPFLSTFLVIGLMSYLYYAQKISISSQKHHLIIFLFMCFYIVNISLRIYQSSGVYWLNIILLLWSILGLVISAFMWVLMLEQIDWFVAQKIPQKYEWLLIGLLLITVLQIFMSILMILIRFTKMLFSKLR